MLCYHECITLNDQEQVSLSIKVKGEGKLDCFSFAKVQMKNVIVRSRVGRE